MEHRPVPVFLFIRAVAGTDPVVQGNGAGIILVHTYTP